MTSQPSDVKICVSAPGKVILHGEHSVVYGKLAIAASLGLRTRLQFLHNNTNVARIEFPALNLLHIYPLQDINELIEKPLPVVKHQNYNFHHPELLNHEEVLTTVKNFIAVKSGTHPLNTSQETALTSFLYLLWCFFGTTDYKIQPFELKIRSDLTVSAGTGSSASFSVTIAAFLIQYFRIFKPKSKTCYKNFKLNDSSNFFDKNELDLISKWAFQSEKIIHGTPSGVDNTICTYGGLVEFRKGVTPKLVQIATKFSVILINTNVARDTKLLVGNVATKREKYKSLVDGILDLMDEVSARALECVKLINGKIGDGSVGEYYENLGELADMNQNFLKCLGVSHPKLDEICLMLSRKGLHGKLTGAGGGGYAICLLPPEFKQIGEVLDELKSNQFEAILTDLGGCGVSIDSIL